MTATRAPTPAGFAPPSSRPGAPQVEHDPAIARSRRVPVQEEPRAWEVDPGQVPLAMGRAQPGEGPAHEDVHSPVPVVVTDRQPPAPLPLETGLLGDLPERAPLVLAVQAQELPVGVVP